MTELLEIRAEKIIRYLKWYGYVKPNGAYMTSFTQLADYLDNPWDSLVFLSKKGKQELEETGCPSYRMLVNGIRMVGRKHDDFGVECVKENKTEWLVWFGETK